MKAKETFEYYGYNLIYDNDVCAIYSCESETEIRRVVFDKAIRGVELHRSVFIPTEVGGVWEPRPFVIGRRELVMITRQFEEYNW